MRVKLLTLRYSASLGGFDDSALVEYGRDRELLAFREHFFVVADVPHLTCVLLSQDAVVGEADLAAAKELQAARAAEQAAAAGPTWAPPPDDQHAPGWRRGERRRRGPPGGAPDPTAGLSEPDRMLFNTLRDWRSRKARDEGVPPFLIFTNRHLLEIVARKPESATSLAHLQGIGPGKVQRYGQQLLALLPRRSAAAASAAPLADNGPSPAPSSAEDAANSSRVDADETAAAPVLETAPAPASPQDTIP